MKSHYVYFVLRKFELYSQIVYIGICTDVPRRIQHHLFNKARTRFDRALQNSADDFTFFVRKKLRTEREARFWEAHFIRSYATHETPGYNAAPSRAYLDLERQIYRECAVLRKYNAKRHCAAE